MKIEFDVSEIENDEDWGPSLKQIIRDTIRTETKAYVRAMVRQELEEAAGPLRGIMAARADALIEQIADEIRALPDERIADVLMGMTTRASD